MKYSKIIYTYTEGDTIFSIPFSYIDKNYLHVYINGEELPKDEYEIENQSVIINRTLKQNDKVSIERKTELVTLVDFSSRNDLKAYDLNLALTQILHVMQEEKDNLLEIMLLTPTGDWNADNKHLTNLAPAVNPSDAVRKDQVNRLSWEGMERIEDNVNFLLTAEATKGKPDGYAPLDNEALIPKKYIPHYLSPLPGFCVNSGMLDDNGNPAILSIDENGIITAHAPFTYTTAGGYTYTQSENLTFDISAFETGIYNIFINPEIKSLEVYANSILYQTFAPEYADNLVWLNNGINPPVSYIGKNGAFEITSLVPLGFVEWDKAPEPEPIVPDNPETPVTS